MAQEDKEPPKKSRIKFDGKADGNIVIPKGMEVATAIEILQTVMQQQEIIQVSHNIEAQEDDAALAMLRVASMVIDGGIKPHTTRSIAIEVGPGKTKDLEWGCYTAPTVPGLHLYMDWNRVRGQRIFTLAAKVMRKDAGIVEELANAIRADLKTNSIYARKSIQLEFRDEDGDRLRDPRIRFFAASGGDPVMHHKTAAEIRDEVFTPIMHPEAVRKSGIPVRRGVLLEGEYGLGKTMQASMIARMANQHGWTFLYLKDARDIVLAMQYAQRFLPSILFVEDIDRAVHLMRDRDGNVVEGRDDRAQGIMNDVDGIGNKDDQFMLLTTSNHRSEVHPGMKRPGRLDSIIRIRRPDETAAICLLEHCAGERLAAGLDREQVGVILKDRTPADITEIVSKATMVAIGLNPDQEAVITTEAIKIAAERYDDQRAPDVARERDHQEKLKAVEKAA